MKNEAGHNKQAKKITAFYWSYRPIYILNFHWVTGTHIYMSDRK